MPACVPTCVAFLSPSCHFFVCWCLYKLRVAYALLVQSHTRLQFWYLWVVIRLLVEALARCEERGSAPDSAFDRFHMLLIFAAWWYDEIVECAKHCGNVEGDISSGWCMYSRNAKHAQLKGRYIYHIQQQKLSHQMTLKNEVESGITFHEAGGTDL